MLFIGEKVGSAQGTGPQIDIALDPLEGTTITAKGGPNALAVLAISEKGGLLNAPDVYMEKLAIGPGYAPGIISLDRTPTQNVTAPPLETRAPVLTTPPGGENLIAFEWRLASTWSIRSESARSIAFGTSPSSSRRAPSCSAIPRVPSIDLWSSCGSETRRRSS